MKFLVGLLGAVVFAAIVWTVMLLALDMEMGVLQHIVGGTTTFFGFAIAQAIYEKKKKR